MKKIVLMTVLLVTAFTAGAQEKMLIAYLDCDPPMASILNKPSGATVMTFTTALAGSDTGEYWIHYSALGLGTSNYGGQELHLHAAPHQDADIVFTFNKELTVMPLDFDGDWIKVKVDGCDVIGWIENEWLCSNPLTNCC